MTAGSFGARQRVVRDVPDQDVLELVFAGPRERALFARSEEVARDERSKSLIVIGHVGQVADQPIPRGGAADRSVLQDVLLFREEPVDPGCDQQADRRRHGVQALAIGESPVVAIPNEHTGFDQHPDALFEEQRVAIRAGDRRLDRLPRDLPAERGDQELPHRSMVQTREPRGRERTEPRDRSRESEEQDRPLPG